MSKPASPQTEDGFTRIANELLEAIIAARFTARQNIVLLAVIRKTYGYGKKSDDIGLTQIAKMTGLAKSNVSLVLNELVSMKIIIRKEGKYASELGVNKAYNQWGKGSVSKGVTELVTVTEVVTVTESVTVTDLDEGGYQIGNVEVTDLVTTIENPKETIQKKARRATGSKIGFDRWIADCRSADKIPIPETDPVFDYAEGVGLDIDFVRMAWLEFKRKHTATAKKYIAWNQVFQNCVRENWYSLWFERDGTWQLTTRGKQLEVELNSRKKS